jgi:signal transduction histidine kinase/HPt (histidine-containing phosphotransfer) domain-containing protein
MAESAVRVLLVDDDEGEYVVVGDLLRPWSGRFDLTWASTYEQGLEAIQALRCDICLVDYRLGSKSGLDLLAEVRVKSNYPPVILLAGEGDRDVDVAATETGAADYLVKGELTSTSLERSIRYALERGRTLQAYRARDLAQSLNLAKSAFVASMSHEMRTPMNAILGMADLLWESELNAEQRQYVEVFRRAGAGLLLLINDVLDVSKIEAGHLELERVEFDLEEVVDQAVELTAVKARAKGIVLLSHLPPGIATCLLGDPNRLRQVLINLLGNAVKFTASGEVVLRVRNHESGKSGQIEFTVSDTGIGIPTDKLEAIFEDFTQADASTTRKYGGTGLGLGISRRLVEAMGGHLTATSSVGQGSTFRFDAQFDPGTGNTRKATAYIADFRGKRALLIDDNATNCFILQETLQAWGWESDAFRLPAEALAQLRETLTSGQPYSLVVLDRDMPEMDGFETATEIRRVAGSLPTIMLTSDARPGDIARRKEAGLSGYAVKPVTRTNLFRLICEAMEARKDPELNPAEGLDRHEKNPVNPARILVAEDSPDNRLLVQAYLRGSPYQVTYEENGKAAVDRVAAADFDLVLMDVQMPVMDGLTATRAIRVLERQRGSPAIPIVAVTANAGLEDIEKSSDAGCDAHLSKPVSKRELLSAIEKYTWRLQPVEIAQSGPHDPIRVEMPSGLEDIIPSYLASRRKEVPEMLSLLAASEFARLAVLGHDLKGSGGGYGFPELTRLGAALEQSAKQTDCVGLRTSLTDLGSYLDRVQVFATK